MLGKVYYVTTPLDFFMVFFLLGALISCYNSLYLGRSLYMMAALLLLFATYQITYHFLDEKRKINTVIIVLFLSSTVVSIYGIWQYIMHILGKGGRVFFHHSAFGDLVPKIESVSTPNQFGSYLLISIPLILALLFYEKKIVKKAILITIALINLSALFLTYSRGSILGLFFALAVLFFYQKRKMRKLLKITLVILLLIVVLNLLIDWQSLNMRMTSMLDFTSEANQERIALHRAALLMISEHPIIGVGIGNFRFLFSQERPIDVHNTLLSIWVETGIIGISFCFCMLVIFFRSLRKALTVTEDSYWKNLILGFMASATGIFVQSLTEYLLYAMHIWFFLGIGLAIARVSRESEMA